MCNLRLELLESEEGPSLGGAILAAVADGVFADVGEACGRVVRVTETVEPDPALAQKYNERYEVYRQIYPSLREVYPRI